MQRPRLDDGLVVQREEECLALLDGAADASRQLMRIVPIRSGGFPGAGSRIDLFVVGPGVRVQRGVAREPNAGAVKLVAARSGEKLNLSVAAPEFRIHRRHDDAHFTDQVRIDERRRLRAGLKISSRRAGIDAVPLHIDLVCR